MTDRLSLGSGKEVMPYLKDGEERTLSFNLALAEDGNMGHIVPGHNYLLALVRVLLQWDLYIESKILSLSILSTRRKVPCEQSQNIDSTLASWSTKPLVKRKEKILFFHTCFEVS